MAGSASFFQTWPREGRRLRHLRRQARPSPVPRQAAPEGAPSPSGTRTPSSARPARPSRPLLRRPREAWNPARPRGGPGGAVLRQARPHIPGGCKHGSQRYTTPAPALAAGHTHTRSLRESTERASGSKFAFPPAVLPVATGARGRQRVNARALAPPSAPSARLPCPRPSCEQRLPRAAAGARWPAGGHHYLQVIGGAGARGVLLTAAGVRFLSSRWILLFMSMFPSSPLFKLNFPRRGRRGERRPGLRGEGRRKETAEGGGVVPGRVRRAGERSPRSQVTRGSGEKPWREKGAGARLWPHYRRPRPRPRTALKPATRRGSCSAPLGPARRRSAREPGLQRELGRSTEGGAGRGPP